MQKQGELQFLGVVAYDCIVSYQIFKFIPQSEHKMRTSLQGGTTKQSYNLFRTTMRLLNGLNMKNVFSGRASAVLFENCPEQKTRVFYWGGKVLFFSCIYTSYRGANNSADCINDPAPPAVDSPWPCCIV